MAYFRRYGYGGYRPRYRPRSRYSPRVVYARPVRRRRRKKTAKKATKKKKSVSMTRFQVATINPFHPDAVGAKLPDANSMPSCPVQMVDTVGMVADGTYGGAAMAFRPFPTGTYIAGASIASATSWTWSAAFGSSTDSSRKTSITSNFTLVRPVAHGVRVSSALSPNTVTGFVHVAIFAGNMFNVTTWDFPTTTAMMSNGTIYKRVPLALLTNKSITIVNRSVDFSNEKYVDPASDVVAQGTDLSFQTTGWGTIIVFVEGAPVNSTAVNVEQLTHLECIPLKSGVADASPAARYNPGTIRVTSDFVNRADPVIISDGNENDVANERSTFFSGVYDAVSERAAAGAYSYGRYAAGAGMSLISQAIRGRYAPGVNAGNLSIMNG